VAVLVTEPTDIDRAGLLDQHACRRAVDLDLGSERCPACGRRGRGDEDRRQPQQRVGLDDDAVADTGLFMPPTTAEAKPEDVTPAHGDPP
jgi:hypothetical protein